MLLKKFKEIGRTEAYEDMKQHILKSRKFTDEEKRNLFPEPIPKKEKKASPVNPQVKSKGAK